MLPELFSTLTPWFCTACGSCESVRSTPCCTLVWSVVGSVPRANVHVMALVPLALEYDCMYCRPSAPLMLISSGVVTERITISAVAPGYCDVTVTVGGEIWGYCEIGSVGS